MISKTLKRGLQLLTTPKFNFGAAAGVTIYSNFLARPPSDRKFSRQ